MTMTQSSKRSVAVPRNGWRPWCSNGSPARRKSCAARFEVAQIKIDSSFDSDDKTLILQKLNSTSEAELSELASCTKTMAEQLVQYRKDNEKIRDLLELVQLPGFNATILCLVADDILKKNLQSVSAKKLYIMSMAQVVPKYISFKLPKTVLAFDLQQQGFSWVLMSADLSVLEWDFLPIPEKFFLTYNHVAYMELAQKAVSRLPRSEIYLHEATGSRASQIKRRHANRTRLESILTTLLTVREHGLLSNPSGDTSPQQPRISVYSFRPKVTAQLFNLLIDGDTVSCRDVMWNIFKGQHPDIESVQVMEELVEAFKKKHHSMQQQVAYCTLEALAFYTLLKG